MATYVSSRLRPEITTSRGDTHCFLELHQCIEGEDGEILGRAVGFELLRCGTGVLGDKEQLQLFHVIARHAKGKITREGGRG